MALAATGFVVLFALCFLGVPLAVGMLIVGTAGFAWVRGWEAAFAMTSQQVLDLSMSYGFSVIPLFLLMGTFIHRAGLSDELFAAARAWLGHLRGGLAQASLGACGAFAAVCGSSIATAATMAKVSLPQMKRYGYDESFAGAVVAAGGTLGILIPPSVPLVIYGILTETDIAKLFIAGIGPGVLLMLLYMATAWAMVLANPARGRRAEPLPLVERLRALKSIWAVIALFALVLGGMYFGLFTPTEAGGMGAAGAFGFMLARGRASIPAVRDALVEAAHLTAALLLVGCGALAFNNFLTIAGLTAFMVEWIRSLAVPPLAVIAAMCLIYIVLGCIFDSLAMIFLTIPVFFPIVVGLQLDPIWFGIIVAIVVELGLITPPVGINVFVVGALLPGVSMWRIFGAVMPFVFANLACLVLIVLVPAIALWLPGFMR
ncbi:MAG: TRAP transporter large permease [Betaproteobacteria bacterium]